MITDPSKVMAAQFVFQSKLKGDGYLVCFTGAMDIPERWDVLRRAIEKFGFIDRIMIRVETGYTETYGHAFERATGQSITQERAA